MDIQWLLQLPQQMTETGKNLPTSLALRAGDLLTASVLDVEKGNDALLSIGQFKAYARLPLPVVTGQDIQIRVEAAGEKLRMVMLPKSGQDMNVLDSERLQIRLFEPISDKGQAGVTQQTSVSPPADHTQAATLSNLTAKSAALTVGSSSPPTVAEMALLREQIQLMVDGTIQQLQSDGTAFSAPMKGALINLQQALDPTSPTGDRSRLAARVRDYIENSGLYFEKRLEQAINSLQARSTSMTTAELAQQPVIRDLMVNDLKPNLLILKAFLDSQSLDSPGSDRHLLETLKSVVQRTLSHIEQQQFMATEKPVDPDLFQAFSHMMFLTDTQRNARLKVYYAKKGRDDAHKQPRVSLLLDMDRMGTVRTDLWIVGKDLNVTFFVKEAEVKAAIETDHHRIGEMLKDIFNTVAVSVVVNEKKIAEFEGEDLTLPNRRQVDLSI